MNFSTHPRKWIHFSTICVRCAHHLCPLASVQLHRCRCCTGTPWEAPPRLRLDSRPPSNGRGFSDAWLGGGCLSCRRVSGRRSSRGSPPARPECPSWIPEPKRWRLWGGNSLLHVSVCYTIITTSSTYTPMAIPASNINIWIQLLSENQWIWLLGTPYHYLPR